MNEPEDELTPEERRFVERLGGIYQAPPLTPAQSAAFVQELESRLARRRSARWLPALAGAAAAAAIAWLAVSVGIEPAPIEQASTATPEEAILELSNDDEGAEETLPEEYVAIASVFLDS